MKVVKFGGSSVANAEQISKIIGIVTADADRRIVVLAGKDYETELKRVVDRYAEIQRDLDLPAEVITTIEADLRGRIETRGSNNLQFMDAMKAAGEDNSAKVIAEAFTKAGHPAVYVNPGPAGMLLSDEFGNAEVLPESFEKLAALKEIEEIIIFPGFFGETKGGEVATFPRGGSDITGAILAAAVKADVYENFTDVDSVCAMDPGLVYFMTKRLFRRSALKFRFASKTPTIRRLPARWWCRSANRSTDRWSAYQVPRGSVQFISINT